MKREGDQEGIERNRAEQREKEAPGSEKRLREDGGANVGGKRG